MQAVSGKKKTRDRLVKDQHPPIITEAEAERVLEKRETTHVAYQQTRLKFPSAGLLKCGECGEPMYIYRSLKRLRVSPGGCTTTTFVRRAMAPNGIFLRKKGLMLPATLCRLFGLITWRGQFG